MLHYINLISLLFIEFIWDHFIYQPFSRSFPFGTQVTRTFTTRAFALEILKDFLLKNVQIYLQ